MRIIIDNIAPKRNSALISFQIFMKLGKSILAKIKTNIPIPINLMNQLFLAILIDSPYYQGYFNTKFSSYFKQIL